AGAFDSEGKPSKAALGFAKSCGVSFDALTQKTTDKGSWLYFEKSEAGLGLRQLLPGLVSTALTGLPIPKRMRWGTRSDEFVRPVKWLLMMIGSESVDAEILGVRGGAVSYGHRFHAPGEISISRAADYESLLRTKGWVVADFDLRKSIIRGLVEENAGKLGGIVQIEEPLLDEVTALVEYPVAVCGAFDKEFLDIPQEALVMTMQDNQKYFAVFDQTGKLMPHFIAIANIDSRHPEVVVAGNERVIRPRFSDAGFFYRQDQKQPLAKLLPRLDAVVFQEQLGSLGDKTRRITGLAIYIASRLGADEDQVRRAAELCKCDLMTGMVGEFPKLQGVMGRYYARHDHEPEKVSNAIEQHYWPRFAGDELPQSDVAQCLALADRLDSLIGIFAIGEKPSGVKDPFALRRAALAVVRILVEKSLPLDLSDLCAIARQGLAHKIDASSVETEVIDYIFGRLRTYYQEQEINFDIVDAVVVDKPSVLRDCDRKIQALNQFQSNTAALALAAANKRIVNILKKQNLDPSAEVNPSRFELAAEKQLFEQLNTLRARVEPMFDEGQYLQGLNELAGLRPAVDQFFDEVMVMVDDESLKNNRLALLQQLFRCFRQVADFSRIQSK
ncbi:MAG: glycine--tRNA ligase subunit beta, partial [Gammaproteobacteria bacterium]|nr:glycine--tRNA ligase subunit beta [Gammaproteobacteria bacterium]